MARLNINIHNYFTDDILTILFNKKIHTTIDFLEYDVKNLTKITNITYKEILDIKKHILNNFSAKICYGDTYYNALLNTCTITPTNIKNFDDLFGGGFQPGLIYEICGFTGTGKTQFCLTVALNISQFSQKPVYYIDTKRDFSSKKLQLILENRNINEEEMPEILNRIKIKQINNEHQLISCLYDIKNELLNNIKYPLIIIDSLPAIFYHTGNQSLSLTTMNHVVNIMRYISVELNTTFLLTNIMIKDTLTQNGNTSNTIIKPGLGAYWNTIPNSRILFENCDNNFRICMTVLKSSTIECNKKIDVTINDIGIN